MYLNAKGTNHSMRFNGGHYINAYVYIYYHYIYIYIVCMHYNRCTYIKQQQLSADNALTAETTRGSLSVAPSKFLLIEVLNISLKKVKSISIKYYTPILTYKHTDIRYLYYSTCFNV